MLALGRIPAIEALNQIIEQWDRNRCSMCGYPDASVKMLRTIVATATAILDRTGLGSRSTIELTKQDDGVLNLELLYPEEREELLAITARFKDLKTRLQERQIQSAMPTRTM